MLWKLAVTAMMLPAYLGISTVTATAAVTPQSSTEPSVAQSVIDASAPQYYANNYNYQSNCKPSYRRQSYGGYQKQNYYRPQHSGYHQTNYHPRHSGYHNNGYHNNGYHNNGYHNNGYHKNGYHNNGYYNNGYGH